MVILLKNISAGVREDASDETVRRVLRDASYRFLHSRKKDLSEKKQS